MRLIVKYISLILVLLVSILLISLNTNSQNRVTDFKNWKGTSFSYPITDKTDTLSGHEIIELRSEKGLPLWFGRCFHKVVCLTGECRMVRLWIFWDGSGNYLGFQEDEKEPLTKTDHQVFNSEDYLKLHTILSDSASVLKNLKQEELIIQPAQNNEKIGVDAYSGATRPSLQEYLVRNAAYTCYTLWHTVYGPTREKINALLDARMDSSYLKRIFSQEDPQYMFRAINYVESHPELHAAFYSEILNLIKSGNSDVAHRALTYFTPTLLSDIRIQFEIATIVGESLSQIRFEILWKLSSIPKISSNTILSLLEQFEKQNINAGLLRYVCELIHPENLADKRIIKKLKRLSGDKNQYVRKLTEKLLSSAKN